MNDDPFMTLVKTNYLICKININVKKNLVCFLSKLFLFYILFLFMKLMVALNKRCLERFFIFNKIIHFGMKLKQEDII